MKKLYSICLVSVLFSMALVAMEKARNEQDPAIWLESLFEAAEAEEIESPSSSKRLREDDAQGSQEDPIVLKRSVIEHTKIAEILLDSVDKDIDLKGLLIKVCSRLELPAGAKERTQKVGRAIEEVVLHELMREGADIQLWEKFMAQKLKSTALHIAAKLGQVGALECLLGKGAQLEAKGAHGCTALHKAAKWGQVGTLECLLGKGAQVEAKDAQGHTALHYAALNGQVGALECLLGKGAQLEAKGAHGCTALHIAAKWGQVGALECLLRKGSSSRG